jgi:DMSO/TMAO reductase YedYZ molybdopterin-dependent catalytic subunit
MKQSAAAVLVATVLVAGSTVAGCATPASPTPDGGDLPAVEIREYEGENLSSINDFRENSIKGPQYVELATYTLSLHGMVENDLTYTYEEVLSQHPTHRKVVSLYCVEGWDVTLLWEGVLLEDLFADARVLSGANTVIFRSVDGYSTSLPLDFVLQNDIMLAHKMNDVVLPPERGFPFQLAAESKWGYKWIKWVNEIELSDDPEFRGYWEFYGYSNDGSIDKPTFD